MDRRGRRPLQWRMKFELPDKPEFEVMNMKANYHTHTYRCRHAVGTDAEYVQQAMAAGLTTLGFSDHTPYWFGCDYYSTFRMFPEQLQDYVRSVEALKQDYDGRLRIRLGVETEFYPAYFAQLLPRLQDAGMEYMLLGQHFVGSEIGEHYCGRPTADGAILKQYCRQVRDAMQTGLFTYLAHPDLLHFTGSRELYRQEMRGICREAKDCGMPLEVNLLGIAISRNYPDDTFWALAAEENCPVILGRDAHDPKQFGDTVSEEKALALVKRFGLKLLPQLELRSIG